MKKPKKDKPKKPCKDELPVQALSDEDSGNGPTPPDDGG